MEFSTINVAFGMVGGLFACLFIVIFNESHLSPNYKASRRTLAKICGAILLMNAFYSLSTYGPRSTIQSSSNARYTPEAQHVEKSEDMFAKERERIGQFDEQIEDSP